MSNNRTLAKFKTEMKSLKNRMRFNIHERMLRTCGEIADNMRAAAPTDEGALARSVRVQDNTRQTSVNGFTFDQKVSVKIKGGGPLTLRRSAGGQVYDYAAAIEFGNERSKAQPFFYPTWRRYRQPAHRAIIETAEEALRGNREIAARRASGFTGSSRHEGVVIGKQHG